MQCLYHSVKPIGFHRSCDILGNVLQPRVYPAFGCSSFEVSQGFVRKRISIHHHETCGVPKLVAEITKAFDSAQVKADIPTLSRQTGKRKSQRVGAERGNSIRKLAAGRIFNMLCHFRLHESGGAFFDKSRQRNAIDQIQWVKYVTLGFGHFLSVSIAYQPMYIDVSEGGAAGKFQAKHDHSGDPEKDNVKAGHEHARGVEGAQFVSRVGPAQGRKGPQGRREPGVQYVIVLIQRYGLAMQYLCLYLCLGFIAGNEDVALIVVPGGNTVTPPDLSGDTPILNIVHPVKIGATPVGGDEADVTVFYRLDRRLGQRLRPHKPLVSQVGFDGRMGAVPPGNHEGVIVYSFYKIETFKIGDNPFPGIVTVHLMIGRTRQIDCSAGVEDIYWREPVSVSDLVIVEIMCWCNFQTACAEIWINIIVSDDGNLTPDQR